jgi:hypothetical protein
MIDLFGGRHEKMHKLKVGKKNHRFIIKSNFIFEFDLQKKAVAAKRVQVL